MSHEASTFTRSADATLAVVRSTYGDRGNSYGDTWALPNQQSALTEYVLNLRRDPDYRAWLRLLQLAVLSDVKESRLLGDDIRDTLIDLIAYRATFAELLREYLSTEPEGARSGNA